MPTKADRPDRPAIEERDRLLVGAGLAVLALLAWAFTALVTGLTIAVNGREAAAAAQPVAARHRRSAAGGRCRARDVAFWPGSDQVRKPSGRLNPKSKIRKTTMASQ